MMISATAAAHFSKRTGRRVISSHYKGYGSGRVRLSQTSVAEVAKHETVLEWVDGRCHCLARLRKLFWKLIHTLLSLLGISPPPLTLPAAREHRETPSVFESLGNKPLLAIAQHLDYPSLIRLKLANRHLRLFITEHANQLVKLPIDQVRLCFDEGELTISPANIVESPRTVGMLPMESLVALLRHLSIQSLFIRALTADESGLVLSNLAELQAQLSQIHFLWCEFDPCRANELHSLLISSTSAGTLAEIGFEECLPLATIAEVVGRDARLAKITNIMGASVE